MAAIAELIRQPSYLWHTHCLRVVRAILDGRYADAEELAATRSSSAGSARASTRRTSSSTRSCSRSAGRRAGWASSGRRSARTASCFPWIPRWRDALAAAELGDRRAARAEVERHARNGLRRHAARRALAPPPLRARRGLRPDRRRAARAAALRAAAAARRPQRRQLHAAAVRARGPAPRDARVDARATGRRRSVTSRRRASAASCSAPAASCRASSTSTRGCSSPAAARRRAGAAPCSTRPRRLREELELPGLLERIASLRDASPTPRGAGRSSAGRARSGRSATRATTFRLRDVKGLRYIALLLGSPGREIHAVELAQAVEGRVRSTSAPDGPPGPGARRAGEGRVPPAPRGARRGARGGARLGRSRAGRARGGGDRRAHRRSWRRRSASAGATAPAPSPAERARVSVTKAIRSAIKTIERHSPALGEHLTASIRTGQFCSYAPPGELPPRWRL